MSCCDGSFRNFAGILFELTALICSYSFVKHEEAKDFFDVFWVTRIECIYIILHKIQVIFWDHPSGKHLCWSFFLTKLQAFSHETLKRDSNTAVSCEICEIFTNFFCYRTLPVAASVLLTLNFFFLAGFCFTNIHESQDCKGRVGAFY